MPTVHLPSQLRDLAGGDGEVKVAGNAVGGALEDLERRHPKIVGRIRDEQGALRAHVKVFVNGEIATLEDPVSAGDEIRIIPAISGGGDR